MGADISQQAWAGDFETDRRAGIYVMKDKQVLALPYRKKLLELAASLNKEKAAHSRNAVLELDSDALMT